MKDEEKTTEYAAKLLTIVHEAINDEDSENHISIKEKDLNSFFYALTTVMPSFLYKNITGEDKDPLEFNHITNRLVFENTDRPND